jgi:ABC-type branched-subunit amino acid transport system substrate-binding protein
MQHYYTCTFSILFISLILSLTAVRGQIGENFKVGLVADEYGTFSVQDTEVKEGVLFWAKWMNDQGGLLYLVI